MLSVEEALARIVAALSPLPAETIGIGDAFGRVLAEDLGARVTQPPAAVSAMDGYAVRAADVVKVPATLRQIGVVPAGQAFSRAIGPGECVRIYTGAPLPPGADTIVIQENADGADDRVNVRESAPLGRYVRPAGLDFKAGEIGLSAGRLLSVRDVALAAAMNRPWLRVRRRPRVAIIATGDEVVMPGDPIGPSQIVSSNGFALSALVSACGGTPVNLGIAPDSVEGLKSMTAEARGADLIVTTGGVSVGEHDLVRRALSQQGLAVDFWRIAMRPGKPLMFGRVGETPVLGLPGNPVSTIVCALIFLRPALARMQGLAATEERPETAFLGADLTENDRRQDYLRAKLSRDDAGRRIATAFEPQDSSMLSFLSRAQCLIVRRPLAPAAKTGDTVEIIAFRTDPAGL